MSGPPTCTPPAWRRGEPLRCCQTPFRQLSPRPGNGCKHYARFASGDCSRFGRPPVCTGNAHYVRRRSLLTFSAYGEMAEAVLLEQPLLHFAILGDLHTTFCSTRVLHFRKMNGSILCL